MSYLPYTFAEFFVCSDRSYSMGFDIIYILFFLASDQVWMKDFMLEGLTFCIQGV